MTIEANTPAEGTPAEGVAPDAAQAAALAAEQAKQALPAKEGIDDKPTDPAPLDADTNAAGKVAYSPTGNSGLDMALKYVGDQGFAPDHPAMVAAIDGNFDLLAAELAGKGAKGYEAYIKLAQNAFGTIRAETEAKQKADKAAVEAIAGGAEQWAAVSQWAAANADEGEKVELKAMLGKGGESAKIAATYLTTLYGRASGSAETDGAGASATSAAGRSAASTDTLNARDYSDAVQKARNAHKGREPFESSQAYSALQDRRRRHRG